MESDPNEKPILEITEDVPTEPTEVNIESTGVAPEDEVLFHTFDVELPSQEQLGQRKQKNYKCVHTELSVITVSNCHINDKCKNNKSFKSTNTLMYHIKSFNKVPRRQIEQDADPVLSNSNRQLLALLFDEEIPATNHTYTHF